MDVTMFLFLLAILPGSLAGGDMHFVGGSLFYKFIDTTSAPYMVRITAVTGWVLGTGPCGQSCSAKDVGRATTATRVDLLNLKGETYFGNWTKEVRGKDYNSNTYATISTEVNNNITEEVVAVNVPMMWEQEVAYFDIAIDPSSEYTDILLLGKYWRWFNYTYGVDSYPLEYKLMLKVRPAPREDTQKPNNTPVTMFKPVYRIMLNKATTIRLSTMDEDGDIVRCQYPEFVEAGGLITLNNTTINPDCSIVIDAQESAGFVDGGWGALPLTVVDIPVKPKLYDTERPILSAIFPQFMIQTVKTIDGPEFVDPTKESQHDFVVYVGSTLMIPLYAKPMQISTREVYGFNVRSIPLRSFTVTSPVDDPHRKGEHVKYSIGKWQPRRSDVGEYVIGALVTDTAGSEGLDRNYHLLVKDLHLLMSLDIPQSGPYFPLFPNMSEVVCKVHSTCTFPIYTNTKSAGANITSVKYTTSSIKSLTVTPPESTTTAGMAMFVSDVTVHAVEGGEQRICFEATDSYWNTSEIKCFGVTVQLPDPCKSHPCGEGLCRSEGQSYVCICSSWRTGAHCETEMDFCASKPCMNNGTCSSYRNLRYSCDCSGTGHFGLSCEKDGIDCKLGVCGAHGVCKDLDRKFECDCYSGYSGDTCNTIDANCNGVLCNNGGVCIVEGGVGVCKCPLGFAGKDCQDGNVTSPVNSATTDNPFTVPSLPNGAEFQCFVGVCIIPVYTKITNNGTLDVHVGFHSTSLTASVITSNRDLTTDTVKTFVSVKPNKKGVHTLCVNSGSTSPDTLCYKVNTKNYTDHHISNPLMMPRFKALTPPDHSVINCIQGIPCYTGVTTNMNPFTNNCTMYSGSTSAIVFKALRSEHNCEHDVMFVPPATGDKEVCLQAGPQILLQGHIFQGERRCFTLKSAASDYCSPNPCTSSNGGVCLLQPGGTPQFQCICPDTASGDICQYRNPCLNHPCNNGSICEGKDTNYACKCPVGFEGKNCDAINATKEPEFTDPSLENGATIECEVGKKCVIQMFTKGPSAELVEGPKVGDVDVKLTKPAPKAGRNINEGQLVVIPKTPGDKLVCVKTKSSATQSDEVRCYHIKTKDAVDVLLKINQFTTPTLPDGSTIKCPEKTQCHIVLHSNPDEKNICPQVKEDEVSKVDFHIFPTKLESGSCVTEVTVEPTNATHLQKFCLKARDDDIPRCFEIDPDKSEPCKTTSCGPHGTCIVETDHSAGCVCDDTHTGPWCAEPAPCKSSPCDNSAVCEEQGASFVCHCSIGYKDALCDRSTDVPSTSKPRFTNAMIPTGSTFNCVMDKVCKIPISIAKPDGSRPVLEVGPHDQGMKITMPDRLSKDIDIPGRSDLYKGHVDVTPSKSGDKKVCVNAGHKSSTGQSIRDDTVCYYMHVTDTEKIPTDSFQEPTPNGGSEIRCIPTEDCHFLVHSKPKVGECPQVGASYGKANVFPSRKDETFTDCITDISVSASELTGSTKIICLKARPDKPERCFHVKPKPPTENNNGKGEGILYTTYEHSW